LSFVTFLWHFSYFLAAVDSKFPEISQALRQVQSLEAETAAPYAEQWQRWGAVAGALLYACSREVGKRNRGWEPASAWLQISK